jgi:hypothetical protein
MQVNDIKADKAVAGDGTFYRLEFAYRQIRLYKIKTKVSIVTKPISTLEIGFF